MAPFRSNCSNSTTSQLIASAVNAMVCRSAVRTEYGGTSGGSRSLRSVERTWRRRLRPTSRSTSGQSSSMSSSRAWRRCGCSARRASSIAMGRLGNWAITAFPCVARKPPRSCICQTAIRAYSDELPLIPMTLNRRSGAVRGRQILPWLNAACARFDLATVTTQSG